MRFLVPATAITTLVLAACSDSDGLRVPAQYEFDSKFVEGESSVAYQGQICRHVLITALTNAVRDPDAISTEAYRGDNVPYFDDTIVGALAEQSTAQILGLQLPVPAGQGTLGELCGGKHLAEKYAGNDAVTDHRDWTTQFAGVNGYFNAETYFRDLLTAASEQAAQGTNAPGAPHYVSPEGIDYAQMVQKLLLGAVAFSQAADDYVDSDAATPGKGLRAAFEQAGDATYAVIEHQIDEGYGYFGAARDYASRSDENNRVGVFDDNGDGFIDLNSEFNFGASTNAAKRDVGSADEAKTDFTGQGFGAFKRLRALVTDAEQTLADMDASRSADVLAARDEAMNAWEGAIAATVVHYINDTLNDLEAFGNGQGDIEDLAKHFSEMKAFALGLQFNPRSPLLQPVSAEDSTERFVRVHELLRDNPPCVAGLCTNDEQYRDDLLAARAIFGEAYGFAQVNLENW